MPTARLFLFPSRARVSPEKFQIASTRKEAPSLRCGQQRSRTRGEPVRVCEKMHAGGQISAFAGTERFRHVETSLGQAGALNLHRGVMTTKRIRQTCANLAQDFFAFRHVHVGNAYVARKRVIARAECPNMDI